jgi:cell division septation protein DedD
LINKICDYALTAGYAKDAAVIGRVHMRRALAELDGLHFNKAASNRRFRHYGFSAAAMLGMALMVTAFFTFSAEALTIEPLPAVANPVTVVVDEVAAAAPQHPNPGIGNAVAPASARKPAAAPDARAALPETSYRAMLNETSPKPAPRRQPAPPAPYALHLGTFRSLEKARRSAARYREKGVPAHWQLMKNDRLYHLCAGKFETPAQAARFRKDHGLVKAVIINAPLTVRVLPERPGTTDADIRRFLAQIGYDSLQERGLTNDTEIYTGLFSSMADASAVADRINGGGHFLAWVVHR